MWHTLCYNVNTTFFLHKIMMQFWVCLCTNHTCLNMVTMGIMYILWDNKKYVRTLGTLPHASKWKHKSIFRGLCFRKNPKMSVWGAHAETTIILNIIAPRIRSLRKKPCVLQKLWSSKNTQHAIQGKTELF